MDYLNFYRQEEELWDSGLKIIKNPKVVIPAKVLAVCLKIQEKVGHNEFSILVKGTWTEKGFKLSDDFIIPEQEVTATTVKYGDLQHYKQQGYNTVIHSHPFKSRSFSSTDDSSINAHFVCSILFSVSEFTKAVITIPVSDGIKLQVDAEIQLDFSIDIADIDTTNIKIAEPVATRRYYFKEVK